MIFLLSFFISWLSGLFAILITAFFSYEEFNLIDITSFASLTLAGCLLQVPLFYLPLIHFLPKKILLRKQFFLFPIILMLLANLPAYFIIWKFTNDLFGRSEAYLFVLSFIVTALVFGICMAWKNNALNRPRINN